MSENSHSKRFLLICYTGQRCRPFVCLKVTEGFFKTCLSVLTLNLPTSYTDNIVFIIFISISGYFLEVKDTYSIHATRIRSCINWREHISCVVDCQLPVSRILGILLSPPPLHLSLSRLPHPHPRPRVQTADASSCCAVAFPDSAVKVFV